MSDLIPCEDRHKVHCWCHRKQVAHIEIEECCRCFSEREIQNEAYKAFKGGQEYNAYLDTTKASSNVNIAKKFLPTQNKEVMDKLSKEAITDSNDIAVTPLDIVKRRQERGEKAFKNLPKRPSKIEFAEATQLMNEYNAKKQRKKTDKLSSVMTDQPGKQ